MRIYPKCPQCHRKITGLERAMEDLEPLSRVVRLTPRKGINFSPCGHAMPSDMQLEIRERPIMRVDLISVEGKA